MMSDHYTPGKLVPRGEWLVPQAHADRNIGSSTDKAVDREKYAHQVAMVRGKYQNDSANIDRLAACWNALDSLPQDALDGGWNYRDQNDYTLSLEEKLAAMTAERDAGRALLEEISATGMYQSIMAAKVRAFLKGGA